MTALEMFSMLTIRSSTLRLTGKVWVLLFSHAKLRLDCTYIYLIYRCD